MKYLLPIILLFFFTSSTQKVIGQNRQVADSLEFILKNKKLNNKELIQIYRRLGIHHPNYSEALKYSMISYELAQKYDDFLGEAYALEEISNNQRVLGNRIASYDALYKALSIYDQEKITKGKATILDLLAINYLTDGYIDSALFTHKLAINEWSKLNDTLRIGISTLNLGEAYRLAEILDSSEYYFLQVLDINLDLNDEQLRSYTLGNLGMVHSSQEKFENAKHELLEAIHILNELGDPYSVSVFQAELGTIYQREGSFKKAEETILAAFLIAKDAGLKEQIRDISAILVSFYEETGNYKEAFHYQKTVQQYQDSLVNRENIQKIEQIKSGYEIEKRETEIVLLNKVNRVQRQITYGLGFGAAVFLFFVFLLFRSNKQKQRINLLLEKQKKDLQKREEEKGLLLKELNHRVKNNLQMVSSLLSLQSHQLGDHPAAEAIKAGRYRVEAMSLIHQKLYQKDHHTKIRLKDYAEELVRNLMYSSEQKTELVFKVEDLEVDINLAIPLALIINELVTNAFKYAFTNIAEPKLEIQLSSKENKLTLQVKDNGKGFQLSDKETSSFGLKLVHSLVDQIDGKMILNNEEGSCWKVTVDLM